MELRGEALPRLLEQRLDGPVLDRLERADLPLALDDEPQRDGLHATRRDALLDRLPEDGAGLVADEPVEHAPRLLRLDLLVVDVARLLDGVLDGVLRDLVEEHATHGHVGRAALRPDLLRHVPRDRLTLAIRIGGDEHFARVLRRALELRDRLLLPRDRHELRLEAVVDVDAGEGKDDRGCRAPAKNSKEVFMATIAAEQIKPKRGTSSRCVACSFTRSRRTPCSTPSRRPVRGPAARRVLDQLGWATRPARAWKTVKKGVSAGRVQTVALRFIVEREREIRAFNPVEYWSVEALLEKAGQRLYREAPPDQQG